MFTHHASKQLVEQWQDCGRNVETEFMEQYNNIRTILNRSIKFYAVRHLSTIYAH